MRRDNGALSALIFAGGLAAVAAMSGSRDGSAARKKKQRMTPEQIQAIRERAQRIKPVKKLVDRQGRVSVQAAARQLQASPQEVLETAGMLAEGAGYTVVGRGVRAQIVNLGPVKSMIDNAGDATPSLVYVGTIAAELGVSLDEAAALAERMGSKEGYYYAYHPDRGQDLVNAEVGRIHPIRKRLEWVLENWKTNPEVTIRTIDLLVTILPGSTLPELPGLTDPVPEMIGEVREFTGNPSATMDDYREIYHTMLRDRKFTQMMSYESEIPMNLDRSAWQWGYTEHIPWIAAGISDLIKERDRSIKRTVWEGGDARDATKEAEREFRSRLGQVKSRELRYILDWVEGAQQRPDLTGMSFAEAVAGSREYHNRERQQVDKSRIRRLKREGKWFDCPGGKHPIKGKVVHTFKNGWTVQEMRTHEELKNEGNMNSGGGCLNHCVGDGSSYWGSMQRGDSRFFSLRAPGNVPYITMDISRDGGVKQAKGKRNRIAGQISDPSHAVGALKALQKNHDYESIEDYLDDEALMLTEFLNTMGFRWGHDGQYVQARIRKIEARKRAIKQQGGSPNRWRQYRRTIGGRVKRGR
jgi:hypothetical protein